MTADPLKALVLAGGHGTRLRPLTYTLPKQLIPVANRPIIHYVMDHLEEAGIREVGVVIAPETGEQIKAALARRPGNLRLTYLVQERPLGLAHAILIAREFLAGGPFVMYLGDNLIGEGIKSLISTLQASRADAVLLLKEVADPRAFGVAVLDGQGRITQLIEKPTQPPSNLALVGVYAFSPTIHDAVQQIQPSRRGELEITDAIQYLLSHGHRVFGNRLDAFWLDCGKKDDLLEANRTVLDQWIVRDVRGHVDEASRVSGRVVLGDGARVERSEVRGPAVIGAGTVIRKSFIGPYTSIGERCQISHASLEHCVVLEEARIEGVERIEDSVIGPRAVLRRAPGQHQAIRFMIGEDTEVSL